MTDDEIVLATVLTHLDAGFSYLGVARAQLLAAQDLLQVLQEGIRAKRPAPRDDAARAHAPGS